MKLGITTGGQVLLLLVLGFFGKQLIEYFFSKTIELKKTELSKEIEVYKQTLNTQTEQHKLELNKILETHRSELNLINTKNSRLHDRQLQIIADLYKKIVIMERAFKEMTAFIKPIIKDAEIEELERIQKAGTAFNDYFSFYTENKIFFSMETSEYLDKLREHFWESHWNYSFKVRTGLEDLIIAKENFDKAAETINQKIPDVLKQLDKNFRQLLTVES